MKEIVKGTAKRNAKGKSERKVWIGFGDNITSRKMHLEKMVLVMACSIFAGVMIGMLSGCAMLSEERVKLRDLDFTVLSAEKIPQELMTIIEEKKAEPFKLTYSDNEYLYISRGYGEQQTGGYSIAVNELYLTDNAVCVSTSLLGPDAASKSDSTPSYPCIVIKTEYLDETVIFE